MTPTRVLTLLTLAAALTACTHHDHTTELLSGEIRSVVNLPGTNALALDAAFDPARAGVVLGAVQSGTADFGRGIVGRPADEPPVLVVTRYDAGLLPFWSTVIDATFNPTAHPALAAAPQGDVAIAVADFAGSVDVGHGPQQGTLVGLMSIADGSFRWSTGVPADGAPQPRALVVGPDGTVVVASAVTTDTMPAVRIDRLAALDGTLLTSRALGVATGKHQLHDLAVDGDGNLLATGTFDGSLVLAAAYTAVAGQPAAYVAKIGRDSGAALWSRPLRLRSADDRVVVAPLADGELGLVGVFAFADDPTDADNPAGPTIYLRAARLSSVTGETLWMTRVNLPNTASLEIVDLADGAANLILLATFSGTLQVGGITAVSTTASAMAMLDFSADDGSTSWLRYSSTVAARGARAGVDVSGDAIGIGTFADQDASGADIASIFCIRVIP